MGVMIIPLCWSRIWQPFAESRSPEYAGYTDMLIYHQPMPAWQTGFQASGYSYRCLVWDGPASPRVGVTFSPILGDCPGGLDDV